jgi:hypothetical protein
VFARYGQFLAFAVDTIHPGVVWNPTTPEYWLLTGHVQMPSGSTFCACAGTTLPCQCGKECW